MIAEIGVLVGSYVITRLIPAEWRTATRIASVLTAVVAVIVVLDLTFQATTERTLLSYVNGDAAEEVPNEEIEGENGEPSEKAPTTTVTRAEGGSITTKLGYGIALAKDSSLKREWIAVHDASLPVDLEGTPGVTTIFLRDGYSSEYRYSSTFTVITTTAVRAVEVRFLTFDVWGDHTQSLSYEEVLDLPAGARREVKGEWRIFSENDVERHYASIAYVARIRLADGRVILANEGPVLAEAKMFSEKFTAADLEPEAKRREGKEESAPNPAARAGG